MVDQRLAALLCQRTLRPARQRSKWRLLTAQWADYGLPPAQSSFAVHATVADHYLEGASFPVGGTTSIAVSVASAIESAGGQDYDEFKQKLAERLRGDLEEHVPAVRGRVEIAELSTPLTTWYFVNYPHGEIDGMSAGPERFRVRCLTARTAVRALQGPVPWRQPSG